MNIRIKNIEVYHPDNQVNNDRYINHFKEQGRDISSFLDAMGKKERYIMHQEEESGLSMAVKAAKQVLANSELKGKDIDYIIYSTQVPEVTFPTNAMYVHKEIEADLNTIAFDLNANCAGMTVAVEQACRYMMSNPRVRRALIVGSDNLSLVSNPNEEITYATYGDASCALILEKTEEETGFIDSIYQSTTLCVDKIRFPDRGIKSLIQGDSHGYVTFERFDASFGIPITLNMIGELLERNNMTEKDIKGFCLSQFAYSDTERIREHFNKNIEDMNYIGDIYGYTGTSSPFISFYEGVRKGNIKRGDTVVFWTVGAGHEFTAMLFKY